MVHESQLHLMCSILSDQVFDPPDQERRTTCALLRSDVTQPLEDFAIVLR